MQVINGLAVSQFFDIGSGVVTALSSDFFPDSENSKTSISIESSVGVD